MSAIESQRAYAPDARGLTERPWGRLPGGDAVRLFTLRNAHGMRVAISELGATLVSWQAPDRAGRLGEILLRHDTPAEYLASNAYFGALVGRCANRIAEARFSLDGIDYPLDRNDGAQCLHGGFSGFHRALWEAEPREDALLMRLASPEGEGGFPGNLEVRVRYALDDHGTLSIGYEARADAPTPISLTSHPYFNLSGRPHGDIGGHVLSIDADRYLEVDARLIPQREAGVAGTAFDFRHAAPLGARLGWPHAQLALAGGFDHCFVLRPAETDEQGAPRVREVARVYEPGSGRELSVLTDQPGLQLYTGNGLSGAFARHGALCLEAGAFPDQINSPRAEAVVLRPGQVYRQDTRYRVTIAP
ncbi:aldose epimerase family protein [Burkholderia sp. A1]|uniref:aldose epimerase family protein n=1 Tax=Burkholderia sp. A1 TaxID=148446 RepID=UPI00046A1E77|nr:aldose epimerase family protein [Burkholderia sp. A1]